MSKDKKKEEKIISKKTKRNVKKIIIIAGIIGVIILSISFIFGMQIKLILEEEMIISLTSFEKSFTVETGNSPNIKFNLDIENPNLCKSKCSYELKDISSNKILNNESSYDTYKHDINYVLPIPNKGEGQKLFNFKVTCNNIKTKICSTNEKEYFKTALITVNYKLSEEEKNIKDNLSNKLTTYLNNLTKIDKLKKEIEYKLNFLQNNKETKTIKEEINLIQIKPNNEYFELWNNEEYIKLNNRFNPSFPNIENLNKKLDLIIKTYNSDLQILQNIINQEKILKEQYLILKRNKSNTNNYEQLKQELETTYNSLNSITSYSKFNEYILQLNEYKKNLQTNADLIIENITNNAKKNTQTISRILKLNLTISNNINGLCINQNNLTKEIIKNNKFSKEIIEKKYKDSNKTELNEDIELYVKSLILNKEFKPKYPELNITNYSEIKIINESNIFKPFYENQCISTEEYNYYFNINNKSYEIIIPQTNFNSSIQTNFSPNNPQCCLNNNCSDCCKIDTCKVNYPIIFLHGHAISESNKPEQSHEAFVKIQNLMEKENFVDAGQIGIDTNEIIPYGDWGRVNAPITIRLSYYLLTYINLGSYEVVSQKTDKIENYAIRLNELINIIKERTGKDKVTIVAHSMGGLVAREYERLFGSNDINMIITVGTPNKGIEGRVKTLCSVTGASRECNDMHNDSLFIKRLNLHTPKVPIYTIRATGCNMEGEDGDGVVLARNVPLEYATNYEIKGNCTDILESNLHTRFLNPDLYPQTYETIMQIINQ